MRTSAPPQQPTSAAGDQPLGKVFASRLTIGPESIDGNGHVNNVEYLRWMQDAAIAHSQARGLVDELYAELGATWVARSHFIEYLRPAFAGETLRVDTWIVDFGRSRSKRKYRFLRESDGLELARAETLWAYVSRETGRPRPIHQQVIDRFTIG